MTSFTPPQELFREIVQAQDLILELLTAEGTQINHWPTYYLLYVDVDRIGWEVRSTGDCIAKPLFDAEGRADAEAIEMVNHCFTQLQRRQKSIVKWLQRWALPDLISVEDKALRHRLHSHFRPKSAWHGAFFEEYCAGKISTDGSQLERTVLLLDPQPTCRIPDLHEKNLVQHQVFDLATDHARTALVDAANNAGSRIGKIQVAMGRYLTARCSIKDLLNPSSL